MMAVLAIAATAADVLSMRWDIEVNPIVLAAGQWAVPLRIAATSFAFSAAALGGSRIRRVVLAWVIAVGVVGALSNVWGLLQF